MITVNSISGGESSAMLAAEYPADYDLFALVCIDDIECRPKDPSIIQYVNAKIEKDIPLHGEFIATAEPDQMLYAMRDLEQYLGREIIWSRGKSFDDVIDKGTQTRLPSWARRYCTEQMKLEVIFRWWFNNIGEKVKMRIGFRADEFDRMLRFFNNSDPCNFSIPVSCSTKGQRLQRWQKIFWRFCDMPLVRDGIEKRDASNYWKGKIVFPKISNCCHCFHKKEEVLMLQALEHENKMRWAAKQEKKDMGTWLDSRVTYETIIDKAKMLSPDDILFLQRKYNVLEGTTCDTGGCTD